MITYIYRILEKLVTLSEVIRIYLVIGKSFFKLLKKYIYLKKELQKVTVPEAKEFLAEIEQVSTALDNLTLKVKKMLVRGLLEENK